MAAAAKEGFLIGKARSHISLLNLYLRLTDKDYFHLQWLNIFIFSKPFCLVELFLLKLTSLSWMLIKSFVGR